MNRVQIKIQMPHHSKCSLVYGATIPVSRENFLTFQSISPSVSSTLRKEGFYMPLVLNSHLLHKAPNTRGVPFRIGVLRAPYCTHRFFAFHNVSWNIIVNNILTRCMINCTVLSLLFETSAHIWRIVRTKTKKLKLEIKLKTGAQVSWLTLNFLWPTISRFENAFWYGTLGSFVFKWNTHVKCAVNFWTKSIWKFIQDSIKKFFVTTILYVIIPRKRIYPSHIKLLRYLYLYLKRTSDLCSVLYITLATGSIRRERIFSPNQFWLILPKYIQVFGCNQFSRMCIESNISLGHAIATSNSRWP